ncbi:MAG: FAD-dependent monooxygenase [Patescibacteria group bacterium]
MKNEYDVIIIGGGPGGLAAAEVLSRHRQDVLLIEKNSVIGPKVCGGGLSAKIADVGIPLSIADGQFSKIKTFFKHKAHWVTSSEPCVATIDRGKLGRMQLARLMSSTVEVVTGRLVSHVDSDRITIDGRKIKFHHLIGADGSLSLVRKYLRVPTKKFGSTFQYRVPRLSHDLELYFDAHRFGSGYGWIMPHRDYTLIGAGQLADELHGHPLKQTVDTWCRDFSIDLSAGRPEAWIINCDYRGWLFGNIFLVGDAGGFTPSFTGEGICNAIITGQEVARRILDPQYTCPAINKILNKKFKQERLVNALRHSKNLFNAAVYLALNFTQNKKLAKRFIDFFLG